MVTPGSSDAASWKRAAELLEEVAAHGEISGLEVPCLLIAAKDDLEPDASCIQSSARVWNSPLVLLLFLLLLFVLLSYETFMLVGLTSKLLVLYFS